MGFFFIGYECISFFFVYQNQVLGEILSSHIEKPQKKSGVRTSVVARVPISPPTEGLLQA